MQQEPRWARPAERAQRNWRGGAAAGGATAGGRAGALTRPKTSSISGGARVRGFSSSDMSSMPLRSARRAKRAPRVRQDGPQRPAQRLKPCIRMEEQALQGRSVWWMDGQSRACCAARWPASWPRPRLQCWRTWRARRHTAGCWRPESPGSAPLLARLRSLGRGHYCRRALHRRRRGRACSQTGPGKFGAVVIGSCRGAPRPGCMPLVCCHAMVMQKRTSGRRARWAQAVWPPALHPRAGRRRPSPAPPQFPASRRRPGSGNRKRPLMRGQASPLRPSRRVLGAPAGRTRYGGAVLCRSFWLTV